MDTAPLPSMPDRRSVLLGSTLFLTIWGLIFVVARLWTRTFGGRKAGWDDIALAMALFSGLAGQGLILAALSHGYGRTVLQIEDTNDVVNALKYSNFVVLCNGIAMAALKVAIGLSLLRVHLSQKFNVMIWIAMVLSLLVNSPVFASTLAFCRPMRKIWNKDPAIEGSCWPADVSLAFSYTQTGGSILTDLLFTLGPLIYLRQITVSRHNMWALRGVFLIGLIATACAVGKCTELPALVDTQDPTHDAVNLTIWAFAELNAGLMAASIPALKSTFESLLRRLGVTPGLNTTDQPYEAEIYLRDAYSKNTVDSGYPHDDDSTTLNDEQAQGEAYELNGTNMKRQTTEETDAGSLAEDQKRILENRAGLGLTDENAFSRDVMDTLERGVSDEVVAAESGRKHDLRTV